MPTLLDARGQPIQREVLDTPQTAQMASLHREFANHPGRGLTPQRMHTIFLRAEQGDLTAQADLFDDMEERDAHILAEMGKRRRAMLTLEWRVAPPRNATAAETRMADEVTEWLLDVPDFEDVQLDALSAIGHGYSCQELEWQRTGSLWLPGSVTFRAHSWFTLDRETRTNLRLRAGSSMDGEPLTPFGWIVHTHKAKSGYLARGGLFRSLAWPYLFRNYSARDLAEFLEIHGLPLRLGKYPSTATPDERRTLLNAVINIGHAAAGIIPEGMMVDFQEAAKGSHDPFAWMIEWCERTVSKAVLGQNVGNDSARKGSLAGSEVDNDVRIDLLKSDARQLQSTLTRDLIFPMLALNRGLTDIKRCPQFLFEVVEPEDMKTYADSLPKLVEGGLQIPVEWAQKKLNIPLPKDGEAVMTFSRAPAPPVGLRAALRAEQQIDRNPAGTLAGNLQDAAADPLRAWLDQIRAMVDQAESMEALRDMLLASYGDLDPAALAGVMQMGFSAAEAGGRFDVGIESDLIQS